MDSTMFPFVLSMVLFVGAMSLFFWAGSKYWMKPKMVGERLSGQDLVNLNEVPRHPSLVLKDFLNKLGNVMPTAPKELTKTQRKLVRAGFRDPGAVRLLMGARLGLALGLPVVTALIVLPMAGASETPLKWAFVAAAVGWYLPAKVVGFICKRRQKHIRRALPNALDLMVICVESGLGLDQAILQAAKELASAHPEISEELALVNLELKAGKRRADALRNLADRTDVEDLKKLVAVLLQADRFGTGVGQSLRAQADYMRVQARQTAEEKAAKLGVKLVFPIFFCILPSLFVVTVGPVVMRIFRTLVPAMRG